MHATRAIGQSRSWQRRGLTVVGLVLTLGVMNLLAARGSRIDADFAHLTGLSVILAGIVLEWALILVVLAYVVWVERMPLQSIGFRKPNWKTLFWGVVFGLVTVAGIGLIVGVLFPLAHLHLNTSATAKLLAMSFWSRVLLVVTAAFGEELLFRGYPIERILAWTGSRWLAGVVTWAAFTYAHLGYWGWTQLIIAGFGGFTLTIQYLWRRDLPGNMLAHFITDGAGLLLR